LALLRRSSLLRLFILFVFPFCASCADSGIWPKGRPPNVDPNNPFAPVALRIHPLTHVDLRPDRRAGQTPAPVVVLHLELRDAYGDTVKGLGRLQVQLYRPASTVNTPPETPGLETQALKWDIPEMLEPDQNASRFDPATRTYRIQLEAPTWVRDMLEDPRAGSRGTAWLKVRCLYTMRSTESAGASDRVLSDEFVLQK
jgi:hypothetical protein